MAHSRDSDGKRRNKLSTPDLLSTCKNNAKRNIWKTRQTVVISLRLDCYLKNTALCASCTLNKDLMQGLRIAIAVVLVIAERGSAFVPSIPSKIGVKPSAPQQSYLMDTQRVSEVAVGDAVMPESSILSEVSCH